MTDDIINQAIEEAKADNKPVEEVAESTTEETVVEEAQETATEEVQEHETKESDDVVFPRKAINAISRRDKQIGKLQAQLAAERAALQALREKATTTQDQDAPNEDNFDNYGDYIKALARHELKQETSQEAAKAQEAKLAETEAKWLDERSNYTIQKAQEAAKLIPNLQQMVIENEDVVAGFHPYIERAFLEADEPAMAFYALAKEGRLEEIANMSPAKAAIEIGKAEVRGLEYTKQRPVTKAPAPIASLKGTGSTGKTLDSMNSKELLKWLES